MDAAPISPLGLSVITQYCVLDLVQTERGARAAFGAVHDAGIEFHHAFRVRKTAAPDAHHVRIVFRNVDAFLYCVEQ